MDVVGEELPLAGRAQVLEAGLHAEGVFLGDRVARHDLEERRQVAATLAEELGRGADLGQGAARDDAGLVEREVEHGLEVVDRGRVDVLPPSHANVTHP